MELDFRKDPRVLASIVDAMADGVFTVDAGGRFVAWSEGAERITGYSAAEVAGKPCTLLEGPNCKGFGRVAELLATPPDTPGCLCSQECKVATKDGRELWLHGNVRVLKDATGAVAGAVGTFADMTEFVRANEKIALLEEQTGTRGAFQRLVGRSAVMKDVFRRLKLAAQSDVTVLLTGESGTGKELAARAIHDLSDRRDKPFLAVNCSALPEALLESELFGHVKGSFTGAVRDRTGLFEAAEGGTLFMDEIGDVSPMLQLKLLRALQEREIRRVGDEASRKINLRLVTATNRDFAALLREGRMREDFYYRIRVFEVAMPPLRNRRDDIPLLADHFLRELGARKKVTGIARDAMSRLEAYPWPGNVRELRNAIEHALVTSVGDRIRLLDLPAEVRAPRAAARGPGRPASAVDVAERKRIEAALEAAGGNRTVAAEKLGWSRVTLWKKLKRMGMGE